VGAAPARDRKGYSEAARRSVSPLDKFGTQILVVIAEQPDGTLVETAAVPRRRRVRTSYSSPWRFLDRHDITLKKRCKSPNGRAPKSPARADVGFESKAWIPPGWYLSTRRQSEHGAPQG
jgi:transposase